MSCVGFTRGEVDCENIAQAAQAGGLLLLLRCPHRKSTLRDALGSRDSRSGELSFPNVLANLPLPESTQGPTLL